MVKFFKVIKNHIKLFFRRLKYVFGNLTVHGPKFLVRKDVHFVYKFIYFIIYLQVWVVAVRTIHKYYEHYQENTIRFTSRTDYLDWNTTLPSITICEIQKVDKLRNDDDVHNTIDDEKNNNLMSEILYYRGTCHSCKLSCVNETACSKDFTKMLTKSRQPCDKLFLDCKWNGKPINCCKHFRPIQTEYGTCFSINNKHVAGNPIMFYTSTHAKESMSKAENFEIKLSQDYEAFLHSPEDIPFWNMENDRRITILYGYEATIIFSIIDVVNEPEVSLIVPEIRQCRFSDEIPANYVAYRKYSYSVCITQCRIEAQIKLCNCTHHLSPVQYKSRYCDLAGLKCLTMHFNTLRNLQIPGTSEAGLHCDCLPSCTEPDYNVVAKKLSEPEKPLTAKPATFMLSNTPYQRVTRQVARTTLDLVVAIGNSFGLCFGGSLLSVVEIVYYLCFRRWKYS